MATGDETYERLGVRVIEEMSDEMLDEIEVNMAAGRAPGATKWASNLLILWLIGEVRRLRGILRELEERARGLT